jgi:hypothetical protein
MRAGGSAMAPRTQNCRVDRRQVASKEMAGMLKSSETPLVSSLTRRSKKEVLMPESNVHHERSAHRMGDSSFPRANQGSIQQRCAP